MDTIATAFWRRIDTPGHDACRLWRDGESHRLTGTAVFQEGGIPAAIRYEVICDAGWTTVQGRLSGWQGPQNIDVAFERAPDGVWTMNGRRIDAVEGCADLDLGFTPATNFLQLKRIALSAGESASFDVAWFDLSIDTPTRLPQHYERRAALRYWYESPTVGYAAELVMAPNGFTAHYPQLWIME
jgi:hypothetical protein